MMNKAAMHPLKIARLKLGFTQAMLADFALVSVPTIKRAEAGKPLRTDIIHLLCEYFRTRYNRQVEPEELGLVYLNENEGRQSSSEASYTSSEDDISEQETENEEEMNRRNAMKQLGNIGLTLAAAPHLML